MTTKVYKHGKYSCKAYKKACGKGWEIGFSYAGKDIFTGNFIHQKEANAWWAKMNVECRKFLKRYTLPQGASTVFFCKFFANYMYKCYYTFLDQQFSKYNKTFSTAVNRDQRKWISWHKHHAA